ncbi:aminodeoxychorismate/anthranilate synthase component II [Glaesserella parasuis]|uniref:aminodeoxychorismate/anthranilate synthase component II n=1 Tax=Glaesserella parasuis TaxID=738 RepID=UPI00132C9FED|nr:aminodeoxychorismate/anthranilate synthase component II [Glaesserella parasuis]MCT8526602.1 aminodeoxychorismate/anthranilate synthase component II [Glaesserella parasuis]MCT8528746.1 aminodeoxychorismate/anthranilate synthase component II [Glaesserella parasuis]MCT8530847.1 aminodeoxychorismate/anthranilate synthase component II [Glaesserella parasuis]MCT8532067.1 aminodeoxychorismate/anthranilate synthase component II [Glaesserella parasuis]MCT8536992.1 aminodeoxychorismate/anthranilate s
MATIIFLDNFDSFTYNLVDQFRTLGHQVQVYRNDCDIALLEQAALAQPNTLLALSPGPGNPSEAGNLLPLIACLKGKVPMIGICLGHQALIESFGGKIVHAGEVLHGKVSLISHDNLAMFEGLNNPMPVARYHSLMGVELPDELIVNATYENIVMAIRHKSLPICGFQFHPESILTVQGSQLLKQTIAYLMNFNRTQGI